MAEGGARIDQLSHQPRYPSSHHLIPSRAHLVRPQNAKNVTVAWKSLMYRCNRCSWHDLSRMLTSDAWASAILITSTRGPSVISQYRGSWEEEGLASSEDFLKLHTMSWGPFFVLIAPSPSICLGPHCDLVKRLEAWMSIGTDVFDASLVGTMPIKLII